MAATIDFSKRGFGLAFLLLGLEAGKASDKGAFGGGGLSL